jgi:hypothetical protein
MASPGEGARTSRASGEAGLPAPLISGGASHVAGGLNRLRPGAIRNVLSGVLRKRTAFWAVHLLLGNKPIQFSEPRVAGAFMRRPQCVKRKSHIFSIANHIDEAAVPCCPLLAEVWRGFLTFLESSDLALPWCRSARGCDVKSARALGTGKADAKPGGVASARCPGGYRSRPVATSGNRRPIAGGS